MDILKKNLKIVIFALGLLFSSYLLTACDSNSEGQALNPVIEENEGGLELLEREFGECVGEIEEDNLPKFMRLPTDKGTLDDVQQRLVEQDFPQIYPSLGAMFPSRGSWRQSKAEIMDIVNRYLWSPEKRQVVPLLHYFDLVLLVNAADRDATFPKDTSAQMMQVFVKRNSSNFLKDWRRSAVWPVSTGIPCKTREGADKISTPTGVYKFHKPRVVSRHFSETFDDADMFETMFLSHKYRNGNFSGVALHGTYKTSHLGRRDSGGCIRLYRDQSKCIFDSMTNKIDQACIDGGKTNYLGTVPSLSFYNGEADPEYFSGGIEMSGYRVLIAIFNDKNDRL